MKRSGIMVIAIGVLLLVGLGAPFAINNGEAVIKGVHWQGQDLSGKTKEDVEAFLAEKNMEMQDKTFSLNYKTIHETWSLKELKIRESDETVESLLKIGRSGDIVNDWKTQWQTLLFSQEVEANLQYDVSVLEKKIRELTEKYGQAPRDAYPIFGENGTVSFSSGMPYIRFDEKALHNTIVNALATGRTEADIPVMEEKLPTLTPEQAKGFNAVLGMYTTYFAPEGNRSRNIALATAAVSGHIVQPGETFSYNGATGSRSSVNGYLEAPVIVGGKLRPGTGGGVCQVSSTLFNAVMLSGLQIYERSEHFSPVSYIPIGRDATVAEGYLDFTFVNNRSHPVFIYGVYEPGVISLYILGDKEDRPISADVVTRYVETVQKKTVKKIDPKQKEEKTVEEGHEGYKVAIVQVAEWADGTRVEQPFTSFYEPVDTIEIYKEDPKVKKEKEEQAKKTAMESKIEKNSEKDEPEKKEDSVDKKNVEIEKSQKTERS